MGKGSTPRPLSVPRKEFNEKWEETFRPPEPAFPPEPARKPKKNSENA